MVRVRVRVNTGLNVVFFCTYCCYFHCTDFLQCGSYKSCSSYVYLSSSSSSHDSYHHPPELGEHDMEHCSAVTVVTQWCGVRVLHPYRRHLHVSLDNTRCSTVRLADCAEDDAVSTAGLEALESVCKQVRVTIIIARCVQYFCLPCLVPSHTC